MNGFGKFKSVVVGLLIVGFAIASALGQGALTNGFTHTATLATSAQHIWTFTAGAGEGVFVKFGKATAGLSLYPRLRMFGPDGVLLGDNSGAAAAELSLRTTNAGLFTVRVSNDENFSSGGNGSYRLTLAQTRAPVFVASYDEGGPMNDGQVYEATNGIAGLDLWTFSACAGDNFSVQLNELTGGTAFTPQLRLYAPDGELLEVTSGPTAASISRTAPATGNYLLIVADTTAGYGTYQLSATGVSPGFKICECDRTGSALVIKGIGSAPNAACVLLTTTNVGEANSWMPLQTNQADLYGMIEFTNGVSAIEEQWFFRLRVR